jgi:hypothetical protein
MNPVLSVEQARKITGGRKPLVPVEYEAALRALAACMCIDDAKYFNDKADALAAWAKIYRDDEAGHEAKRLKLHAYRRMGELARTLRPQTIRRRPDGTSAGTTRGHQSLLREHGLTTGMVSQVSRISAMPRAKFEAAVSSSSPPSPTALINTMRAGTESWRVVANPDNGCSPMTFRTFCRRHVARTLARSLAPDEVQKARELAQECADWLDEFLQCLPPK